MKLTGLLLMIFIAKIDILHGASINNFGNSSQPTETVKRAATTSDDDEISKLPPLLFPDDPRAYKIVPPTNATALKILQHAQDPPGKIASIETEPLDKEESGNLNRKTESIFWTENEKGASQEIIQNELKNQVEEIQSANVSESDLELEEQFRHHIDNLRLNEVFDQDIETNETKLNNGHITAIFVGLLAAICLAIYVGLISWRNYLEKRYGMSERLVTQDDYYNNNDVRSFEL